MKETRKVLSSSLTMSLSHRKHRAGGAVLGKPHTINFAEASRMRSHWGTASVQLGVCLREIDFPLNTLLQPEATMLPEIMAVCVCVPELTSGELRSSVLLPQGTEGPSVHSVQRLAAFP